MPNFDELIPGLRVENINATDRIDILNRSRLGITRVDWMNILRMPGVYFDGNIEDLPRRVETEAVYA